MPNWETMPPEFYSGVALVIVMIAAAIVVPLILRRLQKGSQARALDSRDRANLEQSRQLHELATAASMAAVSSAQRQ